MNYKKILIILIPILSLVAWAIFITKTFNPIGTFFFLFSLSLVLIFAILIFMRKEVFIAWKKFAVVYLPIAVLLIILSPSSCGFMCFDREMMAIWLGAIYVIVSLLIIIIKSIKLRKKHN